jgi:hypothetical protein
MHITTNVTKIINYIDGLLSVNCLINKAPNAMGSGGLDELLLTEII